MTTFIRQQGLALGFLAAISLFCQVAQAYEAWAYTYNSKGQVLTANGPRTDVSDITAYSYDTAGNLATLTNALGHIAHLQNYNGRGQPGKIIDTNGVETLLVYHARGWLLSSTTKHPGGNTALDATTAYTYDNEGQLTRITLPGGAFLNYHYDGARRLKAISNNTGERIDYALDAAGNPVQETIKTGSGTLVKTLTRSYDELSRLRQIIGAQGQTTTYGYDKNGNITTITDGNSQVSTQAHDALDRLIAHNAPLNHQVDYSYDDQDNLVGVVDPKGLATTYQYDGLGNRQAQTSPDTGTTTYTHDEAGNRISQSDANGITVNYSYDPLNRLIGIHYPDTSLNIGYGYDMGPYGKGRLTSITDSTGTTTFDYDQRGNLISQTVSLTAGPTYSLAYRYTLANQLAGITYPDGRSIDYSRDTSGRITQVDTTASSITHTLAGNIAYQPFGPLKQLDYGNSLQLTRDHDLDYRLARQTHSLVKDRGYSYDNNDNIIGINDNLNSSATQTLGYDALNRLTDAQGLYGTLSYTYDASGNRLTVTANTGTDHYTYDFNSHRLLHTSQWTYQYDDNGNQISKLDSQGSGLLYHYNGQNRLVQVIARQSGTPPATGPGNSANTPGAARAAAAPGLNRQQQKPNGPPGQQATVVQADILVASYEYNALGQRIRKTTQTATTYYAYNTTGQLIAELDSTGQVQASYLYLEDEPLAVARQSSLYYSHNDHLGKPQALTNQAGQVVWSVHYTPFGETQPGITTIANNLRFPGQYFDEETHLHYNYFRDYDPAAGRYIQSDPIGLLRDYSDPQLQLAIAAGVLEETGNAGEVLNHLYGYVGQNSLIWYDPYGLAKKKYEKPENPNKRKGAEKRQQSGARERNKGHPDAEEHSRRPKGGFRPRLPFLPVINLCLLNAGLPGCPNYCDINPLAEGCLPDC